MQTSAKTGPFEPAVLEQAELVAAQQRIVADYPTPIALSYRRVLEEPGFAYYMFVQTALPYLLKFLVLVLLADYRRARLADEDVSLTITTFMVGRPSEGTWLSLLKSLAKAFQRVGSPMFVPELGEQLFSRQPQPRPQESLKLLDWLVKRRNEMHLNPPVTAEEKATLDREVVSGLTHVLRNMEWMARYPLVIADSRPPDPHRLDAVRLRGQQVFEVAGGASEGALALVTPDLSSQLLLSPLARLRACGNCDRRGSTPRFEAFLYSDLRDRKVQFQGWHDHWADVEILRFEEVRNVLDSARRAGLAVPGDDPVAAVPEAAASLTRRTIEELRLAGKFLEDEYVPPPGLESRLAAFLDDDRPGLILTARAGGGKTTSLCHLARKWGDEGHVVVFWHQGNLPGPDLETELVNQISPQVADLSQVIDFVRERVGARSEARESMLIVIIDALNERPDAPEAFAGVARLALKIGLERGRTAKVVAGIRDVAMRDLVGNLGDRERFFFSIDIEGGGTTQRTVMVPIEPFSDNQAEELVARYRAKFKFRGSVMGFDANTRHLLRHPLLVRLLAETFAGTDLPARLSPDVLFAAYLDHALSRHGQRHTLLMRRALRAVAAAMYQRRCAQLSVDYAVEQILGNLDLETDPITAYLHFLDEGICMEHRQIVRRGETRTVFGFTFEACLEHLIGSAVLPIIAEADGLDAMLQGVADRAEDLPQAVSGLKGFLAGELAEGRASAIGRAVQVGGDAGARAVGFLLGEYESSEMAVEADRVLGALARLPAEARVVPLQVALDLCFDTGDPEERLPQLGRKLVEALEAAGQAQEAAEALIRLGDIYYNRADDYDQAASVLQEAVDRFLALGLEDRANRHRYFLARVRSDLGDREGTEAAAQAILQHFRDRADPQALECTGLGEFLLYMVNGDGAGRFREAMPHLDRADSLFQKTGNARALARIQQNRANALLFVGTPHEAIACAELAAAKCGSIGDIQGVAYCHVSLAAICFQSAAIADGPERLTLLDRGHTALAKAREVYDATRERYIETMCLANEGLARGLVGDLAEKRRLLEQVVADAQEADDFFNRFDAELDLSLLSGADAARLAAFVAEAQEHRYEQGTLRALWAACHERDLAGDQDRAEHYRAEALAIADRLGHGRDQLQVLNLGYYAGLFL